MDTVEMSHFGYKGQIILETIALSQYQCITQNRCKAFNKTLLFLNIKASTFRYLLEEALKKRGKGFPVLSCSE